IYSIIFSLLSSILLYFSNNYLTFSIFYFFLGIGNASFINSVSSYVCDVYIENKSSQLLLINTGWLLGIFIAPLILSYFAWKTYQFRLIFLIISFFHLLILFVILIKFQNPKITNDKRHTFKKVNKIIFSNKHFILSCLITFFYSSTTSIFSNWLTTYFKDIGIELKCGAIFLSIYSASTVAGMFLKNYLLKYFP
ncbi:MAG: MFS transporter, partial [Actinomycetota bacterium]|nr:MFS transporter [Actinomycetota bacterium]